MSDVYDRPEGANAAPPSRPRRPWKTSATPDRWGQLGLGDPDPSGYLPKEASVADALVRGLIAPGSADPVEGIVDGVRIELAALAVGAAPAISDTLTALTRRLGTATQLLRWCDNREPMPVENDEEPLPSASSAPPELEPSVNSEDMEETPVAGPAEPKV